MMISCRDSSQPVSFANGGERAGCASDVRRRRIAPVRKEPHNESNKNEREPTSGRSTNYGSGHDARTRHAAKSTFCDRYHIVNATAELISYPSIDTACAVLTFDVPPKLSPALAGLSLGGTSNVRTAHAESGDPMISGRCSCVP